MTRLTAVMCVLALAACTKDEDSGTDNDAPRVTIVSPADNSAFLPGMALSVCIAVEDESSDLSMTVSSDIDGELSTAADGGCSDGDFRFDVVLSDANHELTVQAQDPQGERGSDAVSLFAAPDNAPTCSFSAPAPDTELVVGALLALQATASDDLTDAGALSASLSSDIDGAIWSGSPAVDGTIAASTTPTIGDHTYTLTVTDAASHAGTCTVDVTVHDCQDSDSDFVTNCDGDCDDGDDSVYPGADEVPDDTIDQDCNGFDTVSCFRDSDGDSYGIQITVYAGDGSCDPVQGEAEVPGDCDDSDAGVNPGGTEIIDDGIDQDCNDFDTITCIVDADMDGYGTEVGTVALADDAQCDRLQGESTNDEDCDDDDDDVYPGAPEIAGNGTDENCDGEDTSICYADLDDDGFGDPNNVVDNELCDGALESTTGGDCDDGDDDIHPGAPELCDGLHNNCTQWSGGLPNVPGSEIDDDGDDFVECAAWVGADQTLTGGDCDDGEASVYPAAPELCDGLPNDCDSVGWPAVDPGEVDNDGDDYVECAGWVGDAAVSSGDCDDGRPTVYAGAPELCDGLANDCSNPAWPAVPGDEIDDDGDDFVECVAWVGSPALDGGDCVDDDATVYPAATELCDGQVNACGGPLPSDESDDDGDDHVECTIDSGGWDGDPAVTGGDDCLDGDDTVYPAAVQVCDGVNNDCDDVSWPTVPADEIDSDADDYVTCGPWVGANGALAGYDCDDGAPSVYPNAPEDCDGVANDCFDADWPTVPSNEIDNDGDDQVACDGWSGAPGLASGDCDDTDATVFLDATELCDGQLNDCDDSMLPGEVDVDGDRHAVCTLDVGGWDGPGVVTGGDDCDDGDGDTFPGADELCDGTHNDCDGWVGGTPAVPSDETDDDADDYVECSGWQGPSTISGGDDCDDGDGDTFPGAAPNDHGTACMTDVDGDDWGDESAVSPVAAGSDCDDSSDFTFPAAAPNDGGPGSPDSCMRDEDDDDYGDDAPPAGVSPGTDCVDDPAGLVDINGNPWAGDTIHIGQIDDWYDGIDSNCDGENDFDADDDGYTHEDYDGFTDADAPYEDDCDEDTPLVNPGVVEVWYDGLDADCSGGSDFDQDADGEDCDPYYPFSPCAGSVSLGADCNEFNSDIPDSENAAGAPNGLDDDCDRLCDEDYIQTGALVLNEFMAMPYPHDGQGAPDEWADAQYVEVYNPSGQTVTICDGWYLLDYPGQGGNGFLIDWVAHGGPIEIGPGDFGLLIGNRDPSLNGGIGFDPQNMYSWEIDRYVFDYYYEMALYFEPWYELNGEYVDQVHLEGVWRYPLDPWRSLALNPDAETLGPPWEVNDTPEVWCYSNDYYGDGNNRGTPGVKNNDVVDPGGDPTTCYDDG